MDKLERRISLSTAITGTVTSSEAAPLDVVFSSNDGELICIVHGLENWPSKGWTPIGIVVVPGSHNRYGDGSCGVMSLVGMDGEHPESGILVNDPAQKDTVVLSDGLNTNTIGNFHFASSTVLASSKNDRIPYLTDGNSTACTTWSGTLKWPYGGSLKNPDSTASTQYYNYSTTTETRYVAATAGKAGCDFNGIRNTIAFYFYTDGNNLYSSDHQWTTDTVLLHVGTSSNYYRGTAATCAGRFKTIGTRSFYDVYNGIASNNADYGTPSSTMDNIGFWYLPALGELCYIPRYLYEINKIISAINQKYGNVGTLLNTGYVSSSGTTSGDCWTIGLLNGMFSYSSKTGYVRAFMRI